MYGYLTSPVGLNLVVAMTTFKQPFNTLSRAALPLIGLMLGCLTLVIWQPWIAMGLVGSCAVQAVSAAAKRWAWSRAAQEFDRLLRGDEFKAAHVAEGSGW